MSQIQALSPELVNQIAAGEVIERPANVVKELVENALDAGADSIVIEVDGGGRHRIRITDTGRGIPPEELPLAVHSHATSKLREADDLFRIGTLGFRGEALASIGSVAHLTIKSRTADGSGAEIRVKGGNISDVKAAACPPGTVIEVENLFFNVPVRRKFLRTPGTEMSHISEMFIRFALAWPQVRFELHSDGRRDHILPAVTSVAERIGHFFGKDLADSLLTVDIEDPLCTLKAYLAPPRHNRANTRGQYLFVNGRYIRDRMITKAVSEAYKEMIPGGRSPVTFLFLTVPPDEVDVNVHPTKIEVRFRQGWKIFDLILPQFRDTLTQADLATRLTLDAPGSGTVREAGRRYSESTYNAIVDFFQKGPGESVPHQEPAEPMLLNPEVEVGEVQELGDRRFFQVHDMFVIEENAEGIVIIDQHALHERLMYERIREEWREGEIPGQRLLVPSVVDLTPDEERVLEEHRGLLGTLGVEIADFGNGSVAVQAVPTFLKDTDPERFLKDFLDQALEKGDSRSGSTPGEDFLERVLYMMSCKAAIKAGMDLSDEEILRLLEERERVEKSDTCVHGRPTSIKFTLEDLEKYFHRR
jgi:DNA mismatch repair protein MutL